MSTRQPIKIGIVGHAGIFAARLEKLGITTQNYNWADLTAGKIKDCAAVFFFPENDGLDDWYEPTLKEAEAVLGLAENGIGVYTECLLTYGWRMRGVFGTQRFLQPRTAWRERLVVVNPAGPAADFTKGDILDCRGATYGIGRSHQQSCLAIGTVTGTYNSTEVKGEEGCQNSQLWHAVYFFRDHRRQICSNIDIRHTERKGFLPRQRWLALTDRIILYVLPEKEAATLRSHVTPVELRWNKKAIHESEREENYRRAVENNLRWFRNGGLLPEADGSQGIYEGFDTYGDIMCGYRPECQLESALMFHYAAKLFKDEELKKIAVNLIDFTLKSKMQTTDKNADDYGLWHFYLQFREDDFGWMYTDTAARTALGLLHFYRLEARNDCLKRAEITLEALLKLQNDNGVLPDCVSRSDIRKDGVHTVSERITYLPGRRYGTPNHHSSVVSAMAMGYLATGNGEYLRAAGTIQRALTAGFPDKFEDSAVWQQAIGRYLLGLSAIMATPLREEFTPAVNNALGYLMRLRHESGAFVSAPFGDLQARTFEAGIMCAEDDDITDNLYTNNYLTVALQKFLRMPGIAIDEEMVMCLLDFQAQCQPECTLPGQPLGGWTRAFNLRTGDPFAYNGDIGWGPYCSLTGWSNAVISLGLIMRLTGDSDIIL